MLEEAEGGFGKSADCSVRFWLPQKGNGDIEGKYFPYCVTPISCNFTGRWFFASFFGNETAYFSGNLTNRSISIYM